MVCDVSFISLKLALPPALALARATALGASSWSSRNSRSAALCSARAASCASAPRRRKAAEEIAAWLEATQGWSVAGLLPSPLAGGDGNQEFLLGAKQWLRSSRSNRSAIAATGRRADPRARLRPLHAARRARRDRAAGRARQAPRHPRAERRARRTALPAFRQLRRLRPADAAARGDTQIEAQLRRRRPRRSKAWMRRSRRRSASGRRSRRRAVLTALRAGDRIVLGYNERLSNRLIDIEECPVLVAAARRAPGRPPRLARAHRGRAKAGAGDRAADTRRARRRCRRRGDAFSTDDPEACVAGAGTSDRAPLGERRADPDTRGACRGGFRGTRRTSAGRLRPGLRRSRAGHGRAGQRTPRRVPPRRRPLRRHRHFRAGAGARIGGSGGGIEPASARRAERRRCVARRD